MAVLKSFRYERPASFEQLSELLAETGIQPHYMAGGTDLLVDMRTGKKAPELVIDLKGLPGLDGIRAESGNRLWIGALTSIHSLECDPTIAAGATALYEGAQNLGSCQVRNRGTIGGNLGNGAPTADTAAPLLALNAVILTWSPREERRIPSTSFWLGAGKTNLTASEMITGIEIPLQDGCSSAYIKLGPRKAMDIAIACAATVVKVEQGVIKNVRIALGGAGPVPVRAKAAEEYLTGCRATGENAAVAGRLALKDSNPRSSSRASREYRLAVIPVLAERAIRAAIERQQETRGRT